MSFAHQRISKVKRPAQIRARENALGGVISIALVQPNGRYLWSAAATATRPLTTMFELEGLADWANRIGTLPANTSTPARTIIVPSEAIASALRGQIAADASRHALCGTRFIGPFRAAMEVLREAGIEFYEGEDVHRPRRLLELSEQFLTMRSPIRQLMGIPEWEHELARTITDLEGAGLAPGDLVHDPTYSHFAEIADLWAQVDTLAGRSWTGQRILREAALVLEQSRDCWPFTGPVLAVLLGQETVVHHWFLRVVPHLEMGLVREGRREELLRMAGRYGVLAQEPLLRQRNGRFGELFSETVHRAVRMAVQRRLGPDASLALATRATNLRHHLNEAARDVARALTTLHGYGILKSPSVHFDFAVPHASDAEPAATGYVDIASIERDHVTLLDMKTDAAPEADANDTFLEGCHAEDARRLTMYAQSLSDYGFGSSVSCGILRTSDGALRFSRSCSDDDKKNEH
jgi:hypothetical protein